MIVSTADSREAGSCCACTRHTHENGTSNHRVYKIEMHRVEVRVCEQCRQELIHLLANANGTVVRKRARYERT